jgi:uncharacterized protein
MSGRLPQYVQPARLAETGGAVRGTLRVEELSRVAESLHDTEGTVDVELQFGIDEIGTRYIRGRLRTVLHMTCQRCLQALACPMDVQVLLGIALPGRTGDFPERYEVLELEEENLDLVELIEDELMLALPIVPRHAPDECKYDSEVITLAESHEDPAEERQNPFKDLAGLLKKSRS